MSHLQLFIVFHSVLYDDYYKDIKQEDLDKYFTFVAVNKNIDKKFTKGKYKIINEWDLPIYDSKFQERGYNENSVIYHIYINKMYDYDKIGFFQYDMRFNKGSLNYILTNKDCSFYLASYKFSTIKSNCTEKVINYIIEDYEKYRNKKVVTNKDYPMLNSYIIDKNDYINIMDWVVTLYDKLYPWALNIANKNKSQKAGHIGGVFEAIMALSVVQYNSLNIKGLQHFVKHDQTSESNRH